MMAPPRSILVINVTRIGDTLLTTPALRALAEAWPAAKLTVLAHPKRAEILRHLPFLARVGGIEKQRAVFMGHWPGKTYDLALVYGHDQALFDYALRVAGKVVAFHQADDAINARLFKAVDEPLPYSEHAVDSALRLTAALGIRALSRRLAYHVTGAERRAAEARLSKGGMTGAYPLIGLQAASFPTKAYRDWPLDHFIQICRRISAQYPNAAFLLFGGPDDRQRTAALAGQIGPRTMQLAGLPLRPTAACMSLLTAYVGVDTGPTHIMSSFDIPMIGLYHCLLPRSIYGPLDHPLDFSLDHPRLGGECSEQTSMAEITVDQVHERLVAALAASARG